MRLQKILSQAGITSRRNAEELIKQGQIKVNGKTAQLGMKADPDQDAIKVKGKLITTPRAPIRYYIGYKPSNMITSLADPQGRPTIQDMLSRNKVRDRVYPVGRLDWDAEGLVLLTNDGEVAHKVMHPRTHLQKVYRVKVRGEPSEESLDKMRRGMILDGRKTQSVKVSIERRGKNSTWLCIVLYEGRQHQIKKMCERIRHPVVRIIRTAIGPLWLRNIARGRIRVLTDQEVQALKKALL